MNVSIIKLDKCVNIVINVFYKFPVMPRPNTFNDPLCSNYTGIIGGSLSYSLRVKFLEVAIMYWFLWIMASIANWQNFRSTLRYLVIQHLMCNITIVIVWIGLFIICYTFTNVTRFGKTCIAIVHTFKFSTLVTHKIKRDRCETFRDCRTTIFIIPESFKFIAFSVVS